MVLPENEYTIRVYNKWGRTLGNYTPYDLRLSQVPADVLVIKEGNYAVVLDGKTKEVIAISTDHSQAINASIENGRRIFVTGDFDLYEPIKLLDRRTIIFNGKLSLQHQGAAIEAFDKTQVISHVTIVKPEVVGNLDGQIGIDMEGMQFSTVINPVIDLRGANVKAIRLAQNSDGCGNMNRIVFPYIYGGYSDKTGNVGISIENSADHIIKHPHIWHMEKGIVLDDAVNVVVKEPVVESSGYGYVLQNNSYQNRIVHPRAEVLDYDGVLLDSTAKYNLIDIRETVMTSISGKKWNDKGENNIILLSQVMKQVVNYQSIDSWSSGGTVTPKVLSCQITSPASSGGVGYLTTTDLLTLMTSDIDLDLMFTIKYLENTDQRTIYLLISEDNALPPDLTKNCAGFKVDGWRVYAVSGDGSATQETDTGIDLLAYSQFTRLRIYVKISKYVVFWVNGKFVGLHETNVPSKTAYYIILAIESKDGNARRFDAGEILIKYVEA